MVCIGCVVIYLHQALLCGLHERGYEGDWKMRMVVVVSRIQDIGLKLGDIHILFLCYVEAAKTHEDVIIPQLKITIFKSSGVTPKEQHIIDTLEEFIPEQLGRIQIPCCMCRDRRTMEKTTGRSFKLDLSWRLLVELFFLIYKG